MLNSASTSHVHCLTPLLAIILSRLSLVVDDDVCVVRHDQMLPIGRLVHRVLPPLLLEDPVDHGVVGTFGGEGGVRHQGAVHAVP